MGLGVYTSSLGYALSKVMQLVTPGCKWHCRHVVKRDCGFFDAEAVYQTSKSVIANACIAALYIWA